MEKALSAERHLPIGMWEEMSRKLLFSQFEKLEFGQIIVIFQGTTRIFGKQNSSLNVKAEVKVHDAAFFPRVVFGGTVGAGESFMDGDWEVDNLPGLVRIMVRNRSLMNQLDSGFSLIKRPIMNAIHALNRNTRKGSARNIAAHYDLGNEFFETFLDPTMMYSCAYFWDDSTGLHTASIAKINRICLKLGLKPGDKVVEIGSGWGAFAVHAAINFHCHVTTTTISQQQYDRCVALVEEAGVSDRVTVLKQDYRDLTGQYDKLVSIEMIEAVGHQFLNNYMAQCSKLLKDDGVMLIQAITINDQFYDQAVKSVDFIKRYIFPGSFIPSVSAIMGAMKSHTDLRLFHLEDLTQHYVRTLQSWRKSFLANREDIQKAGYDEPFTRMWDFYLSYCEGGFQERSIGCAHLVFTKPQNRLVSLEY